MDMGKPIFPLLWRAFIFVSLIKFVNALSCPNSFPDKTGSIPYCGKGGQKDDSRCCDKDNKNEIPINYSPNKIFCDELFRDDEMGWNRYFTGYLEGRLDRVQRRNWIKICGQGSAGVAKGSFRAAIAESGVAYYANPGGTREYTNRLRFTDSVIAQEGLSFCVVGSHYRKSAFSLWDPLKPFMSLAEKSFDIGNHIDPEDSTKMNAFKRPSPGDLRRFGPSVPNRCTNDDIWCGNWIPTHRFENVWLGQHRVREIASSEAWVPLAKGFEKRPAHPEWQPDENCKNPYRVTSTLIQSDGLTLHNYLHIKVYAEPVSQPNGKNCPSGKIKLLMLEVRDQDGLPVGQFTDDVPCDKDEKTTGAHLACPAGATCKAYKGTKMNVVPCMFSHPKSVVHPTIFMMAAGGGDSGSSPGGGAASPSSTTQDDVCRNSQIPQSQRKPPIVKYKDNPDQYFTEVHATWRFAQMDESWVSQLHFATLIIEDETPIQYYTSRLTYWEGVSESVTCTERGFVYNQGTINERCGYTPCCWYMKLNTPRYKAGRFQLGLISSCVNETYNINRPYGYSARYTMLRPTFNTRGGWDYFRKQYVSPLDVDCHVDIPYGPDFYYERENEDKPEKLGKLPLRKTLSDFLKDKYTLEDGQKYKPPAKEFRYGDGASAGYRNVYELPDWHSPGMSLTTNGTIGYHAYYSAKPEWAAFKMFDSAHQDPIVLKTEFDDKPFREYFGSRYILPSSPLFNSDVTRLQTTTNEEHDQEFTMAEMTKESKSRCPCPFVPTTYPPELATKPPVEIEGRRTHVINMLVAWVILVPLAFFISRFFKETYSRVFFLQEFWWLAIHVLTLVTALLFSIGSIYALKAKRSLGDPYEVVWTDATIMHIYFGYGVLGIFFVHLLIGSFRFSNTALRMLQIGLHWLFGWLEYLFAAGSILAAAAIPSGIMSCTTFGIYCAFLVYQVVFTLGMEYHMRKVDEILNLDPPRTYLPPPVMRVFHRDAPHAKFRVIMLIVFFVGCFLFYTALHVSMNMPEGEASCFQPTQEVTAEEFET